MRTDPDSSGTDLGFDPASPPGFFGALAADVRAHGYSDAELNSRRARFAAGLKTLVRSPGFRMILIHRAAVWLRLRLGWPGRVLSSTLYWWVRHFYGCSIATTARIRGGAIFPHPQGIVIGPDVELGPRAWIFQNVTIGGSPGREGMPVVGADARLFPGAVIVGPVRLGRNVVVGANAVVTRDLPAQTLARPAALELSTLPQRLRVDGDTETSAT